MAASSGSLPVSSSSGALRKSAAGQPFFRFNNVLLWLVCFFVGFAIIVLALSFRSYSFSSSYSSFGFPVIQGCCKMASTLIRFEGSDSMRFRRSTASAFT